MGSARRRTLTERQIEALKHERLLVGGWPERQCVSVLSGQRCQVDRLLNLEDPVLVRLNPIVDLLQRLLLG